MNSNLHWGCEGDILSYRNVTSRLEHKEMMTMKRACKIIPLLASFFVIIPAVASGGQYKITRVYEGDRVRAEGYDRHCLP
jgi:hypothetical protein